MNETTTPRPGTRIELYVQSLSPHGARAQQDEAIERLLSLAEDGPIEEFALHVWGKHLCTETAAARTELGTTYVERLERFREWVGENGEGADDFLDPHEIGDRIGGEPYTAVPTPVLLLAEFDGDELRHVAPCRCESALTTVHERIAAIERLAGGPDAADGSRRDDRRAPGVSR